MIRVQVETKEGRKVIGFPDGTPASVIDTAVKRDFYGAAEAVPSHGPDVLPTPVMASQAATVPDTRALTERVVGREQKPWTVQPGRLIPLVGGQQVIEEGTGLVRPIAAAEQRIAREAMTPQLRPEVSETPQLQGPRQRGVELPATELRAIRDAQVIMGEPPLERYTGALGAGAVAGAKGLAASSAGVSSWIADQMQAVADTFQGVPVIGKDLEVVSKAAGAMGKAAKTTRKDIQRSAQETMQPYAKFMAGEFQDNPSLLRALIASGQSVPSFTAAVAAGLVTGNPMVGAGLLGSMEGESGYHDAQEAGRGQAVANAVMVLSTVGTTLLEGGPVGTALKAGNQSLARRVAQTAIAEGLKEEPLQTVWNGLVRFYGVDDSKGILRSITDGIVDNAIGGLAGGAVGGAVGGLAQPPVTQGAGSATDSATLPPISRTIPKPSVRTRAVPEWMSEELAGELRSANERDALMPQALQRAAQLGYPPELAQETVAAMDEAELRAFLQQPAGVAPEPVRAQPGRTIPKPAVRTREVPGWMAEEQRGEIQATREAEELRTQAIARAAALGYPEDVARETIAGMGLEELREFVSPQPSPAPGRTMPPPAVRSRPAPQYLLDELGAQTDRERQAAADLYARAEARLKARGVPADMAAEVLSDLDTPALERLAGKAPPPPPQAPKPAAAPTPPATPSAVAPQTFRQYAEAQGVTWPVRTDSPIYPALLDGFRRSRGGEVDEQTGEVKTPAPAESPVTPQPTGEPRGEVRPSPQGREGQGDQGNEQGQREEAAPGLTEAAASSDLQPSNPPGKSSEGQQASQRAPATTEQAPVRQPPPRMAESADDLHRAFSTASRDGVVGPGGVLYPVLTVFGEGRFQWQGDEWRQVTNGGMTSTKATRSQVDAIEEAIDGDQAQVLLMSRWGGSGRDTQSKPVRVLHSPRGNAWANSAPAATEQAPPAGSSPVQPQERTTPDGQEREDVPGVRQADGEVQGARQEGQDEVASRMAYTRQGNRVEILGAAPGKPGFVRARDLQGKVKVYKESTLRRDVAEAEPAAPAVATARQDVGESRPDRQGEPAALDAALEPTPTPTPTSDETRTGAEESIFPEDHFQRWLDQNTTEDDRVVTEQGIRRMVAEYPELIEKGRSWPEIRALAERNGYLKADADRRSSPKKGKASKTDKSTTEPEPPEGPKPGGKSFRKIQGPTQQIEAVAEAFGVKVAVGRFRQKAMGIFKRNEHVIRLRHAGDVQTFWHEFGHWLQDRIQPEVTDEVRALAPNDGQNKSREGFAEFIKLYVTNPVQAQALAPQFFAYFEGFIQGKTLTPQLGGKPVSIPDAFTAGREAWSTFRDESSVSRLGSIIRSGRDAVRERLSFRQLYQSGFEAQSPLQAWVKRIEGALETLLRPSKNPATWARLTRGTPGHYQHFLVHSTFIFDQAAPDGMRVTGEGLVPVMVDIGNVDVGVPTTKLGKLAGRLFGREERLDQFELLSILLLAKRAQADARVSGGLSPLFTKAEFDLAVAELEPLFGDIPQRLYDFQERVLDYLVSSGRLAADEKAKILESNQFYAPLYRVMDGSPFGATGKTLADLPSPLKRMTDKGSTRDVWDPLESIIYNTVSIISVADRNRVGVAIAELAEDVLGLGQFAEHLPPRMKPLKVDASEIMDVVQRFGTWRNAETHQTVRREFTTDLTTAATTPNDKVEARVKEALLARGFSEGEATQMLARVKGKSGEAVPQTVEKLVEEITVRVLVRELVGLSQDEFLFWRPNYTPKGNEVIFYRDGKPWVMELDPDLREALTNLGVFGMDRILHLASTLARWRRAGATLNTVFPFTNLWRDMETSFVGSEHGVNSMLSVARDLKPFFVKWFGMTPEAVDAAIKKARPLLETLPVGLPVPGVGWVPLPWDAVQGIYSRVRKNKHYQRYLASGGALASQVSIDRPLLPETMDALADYRNMQHPVRRMFRGGLIGPLQRVGDAFESANRIPAVTRALQDLPDGWTPLDALLSGGLDARDATVDFPRAGSASFMHVYGRLTAFLPSALQGLDKSRRLLADPRTRQRTLLRLFFSATLPSIVSALLLGDDEDYAELPAWRVIMARNYPIRNAEGELLFTLSLPRGFIMNVLAGAPFELAIRALKKEDPAAWAELAGTVLKEMIPFGLPSGSELPIELAQNWDLHFDRYIVPPHLEKVDAVEQYTFYTPEVLKALARGMDDIPGLRKVASPAKWEHVIRSLSGRLGIEAVNGLDILLAATGVIDAPPRPARSLSDLPLVAGFVVRHPHSAKSIGEFYRRLGELQGKQATGNVRIERSSPDMRLRKLVAPATVPRLARSAELQRFEKGANAIQILRAQQEAVRMARGERWEGEEGRLRKRNLLDALAYGIMNQARIALGEKPIELPKSLKQALVSQN